ncbi:MAG: amidase [Anaerolineaceae bacterium]|nr:MAG: amidase [Anaerolineaceae bacterium]
MMKALIAYDAIGLAELIRDGEISPVELLENTIRRIEAANPRLNAVIYKMYDQAYEQAEQWGARLIRGEETGAVFGGVPFLLKDLLAEYRGAPFCEGSRAIEGYVSKVDSELVIRQKAGGLVIVGKTNTPEFGGLPLTDSTLHGPSLNPWDTNLTPGGSSGGSAVAVAAGIVPMAHGNDGGGSIRIPASCCGLFGLKPTRGRNPLGPLFGDLAGGLVSEHALTRTVRDSAALLDVTSGAGTGDPYYAPSRERPFWEEVQMDAGELKIGFLTSIPEGWSEKSQIHPDCVNAVHDAAWLCEGLGHIVEEIAPDQLSDPKILQNYNLIWSCLIGHIVAYWERELGRKIEQDELEPINWEDYQDSLHITGADYLVALEEIQRFSRKVAHWHRAGGYDLLLNPTMRIPPSKYGTFESTREEPMMLLDVARSFSVMTHIQNLTGQPAMSVPLFWNEEQVPIGVQFAGRFGDEATLFRLAAQLERARPWVNRRPPLDFSEL